MDHTKIPRSNGTGCIRLKTRGLTKESIQQASRQPPHQTSVSALVITIQHSHNVYYPTPRHNFYYPITSATRCTQPKEHELVLSIPICTHPVGTSRQASTRANAAFGRSRICKCRNVQISLPHYRPIAKVQISNKPGGGVCRGHYPPSTPQVLHMYTAAFFGENPCKIKLGIIITCMHAADRPNIFRRQQCS